MKILPPTVLIADCTVPPSPQSPATNLDLLQYAVSLQVALKSCNQDKARLRAFYEEK